MATATKKAPKAKATPVALKARPGNLAKVSKPEGDMPALLEMAGDEPTTAEVAAWMNALGDAHEERDEVLTSNGYKAYTEQIEDAGLMKKVQAIAKKLLTGGLAATAAAAKPSANGHAKAGANGKASAPKEEKAEATPVKLGNVHKDARGIPVVCTSGDSGRKRCLIYDLPMRNVIRALAHKGWDNTEIEEGLKKLGIAENYHEDLRGQIITPHAAAGRNAKKATGEKDDTVYGAIPKLTKDQFAELEKLRK